MARWPPLPVPVLVSLAQHPLGRGKGHPAATVGRLRQIGMTGQLRPGSKCRRERAFKSAAHIPSRGEKKPHSRPRRLNPHPSVQSPDPTAIPTTPARDRLENRHSFHLLSRESVESSYSHVVVRHAPDGSSMQHGARLCATATRCGSALVAAIHESPRLERPPHLIVYKAPLDSAAANATGQAAATPPRHQETRAHPHGGEAQTRDAEESLRR